VTVTICSGTEENSIILVDEVAHDAICISPKSRRRNTFSWESILCSVVFPNRKVRANSVTVRRKNRRRFYGSFFLYAYFTKILKKVL